jgi:hypothetical protein
MLCLCYTVPLPVLQRDAACFHLHSITAMMPRWWPWDYEFNASASVGEAAPPPHLKLNSISLRAARWYYLEFYYNHPLGLHFLISAAGLLHISAPRSSFLNAARSPACLSAVKRALCQFSSISQQLSSNFMDIVGTNAWFSPASLLSFYCPRASERALI